MAVARFGFNLTPNFSPIHHELFFLNFGIKLPDPTVNHPKTEDNFRSNLRQIRKNLEPKLVVKLDPSWATVERLGVIARSTILATCWRMRELKLVNWIQKYNTSEGGLSFILNLLQKSAHKQIRGKLTRVKVQVCQRAL